jgi:hypothetical protein
MPRPSTDLKALANDAKGEHRKIFIALRTSRAGSDFSP